MNKILNKGMVIALIFTLVFIASNSLCLYAYPQAAGKKININTASLTELQELPRIGEKTAQRIIDFRKEHGNFKKIEEIMKVKGIGEKVFAQLKDLITVGAEKGGK
jgi:competence protein ComEA